MNIVMMSFKLRYRMDSEIIIQDDLSKLANLKVKFKLGKKKREVIKV